MKKINSIIFIIILLFLVISFYFSDTREEKVVHFIIKNKILDNKYNQNILEALQYMLKGTKFENSWQINKIPKYDRFLRNEKS